MNENSLVSKLKKKSLLWYASWLLIIISVFGIIYGGLTIYDGTQIPSTDNEVILDTLDSLGMTAQDGANAFISFGIVIIVYYLLMLGIGILGLLSSRRHLLKLNIFWFAIVLISIAIILGFLGILTWNIVISNFLVCILFAISVYRKYNLDQRILKKKKRR